MEVWPRRTPNHWFWTLRYREWVGNVEFLGERSNTEGRGGVKIRRLWDREVVHDDPARGPITHAYSNCAKWSRAIMLVTCKPLGLEAAKDGLDEGKNDNVVGWKSSVSMNSGQGANSSTKCRDISGFARSWWWSWWLVISRYPGRQSCSQASRRSMFCRYQP